MQSAGAERDGVVGVGVLAECVDRGEDGAQAVGVVGEERGGWWIAFCSRETWRLTWARAGGSVGEAEAAANLGSGT